MLFILTGDIQIGKTRWLERLTNDLAQSGVPCAGVIAPGIWRENHGNSGESTYEKLGITNVLLPQGIVIEFARRRDLAQATGTYHAGSQSAQAGLGWEISDAAIAQVNEHFKQLAKTIHQTANIDESPSQASQDTYTPGLLVVDELGQLELKRNGGLTAALGLLDQGPTKAFPHALIVVREWLAPDALARFGGKWQCKCISPNDAARNEVAICFGVSL